MISHSDPYHRVTLDKLFRRLRRECTTVFYDSLNINRLHGPVIAREKAWLAVDRKAEALLCRWDYFNHPELQL